MNSRQSRRPGYFKNAGSLNPPLNIASLAPNNPKNNDIFWSTVNQIMFRYDATLVGWVPLSSGPEIDTIDTHSVFIKNSLDVTVMAMGVLDDITGTPNPILVFGAGDGYGNNRGYIWKNSTSLDLVYAGDIDGPGPAEISGIKLYKDKIEATHEITVNVGLINEFVLSATNWNNKLYEADAKTIIENPAKAWQIPKENILSVYAQNILGDAISTFSWTGAGTHYIYMTQQLQYFKEYVAGPDPDLTKLAIGFAPDHTGTQVPLIVLGAGAGNDTSIAKGYLTKTATGLNLYYISAANVAHGISIQSDGIHVTKDLILDTALATSYLADGTTFTNKLQKMDTSGHFGTVNLGAKRTQIDTSIKTYNSSNQLNGLVVDPTYSDMILYYAGAEVWKMYNNLDSTYTMYIANHAIGYGTSTTFYPQSNWNFTYATVTNLTPTWG